MTEKSNSRGEVDHALDKSGRQATRWGRPDRPAPSQSDPSVSGRASPSGQRVLDSPAGEREAAEKDKDGTTPPSPPRSAADVLARRWWVVLLVAIVIAAATYEISNHIPARYSSSATVAVQVSGSDPNATTQAADNLASQYAQQVGAQPVLAASSRILHESPGDVPPQSPAE
jgi:hypothetical protein